MSYGVRLCSFHTASGRSEDGKYRWDFSSQFGPLFVSKKGVPLKNQPGEHHPAWTAFERWYKQWKDSR